METLRYYLGPAVDSAEDEAIPPVATIDDVMQDILEVETQGLVVLDGLRDFPETGGTLMVALVSFCSSPSLAKSNCSVGNP
jgi:hypothetical protein